MTSKLPTTENNQEINALKVYCLDQFRDINLILRESVTNKEEFNQVYARVYEKDDISSVAFDRLLTTISMLDNIFKTLETSSELIAYRKLNSRWLGNLEVGDRFVDKGFLSTSLDETGLKNVIHHDTLKYDVTAMIQIPRGTKCVYVGELFNREENELLLNRNTTLKLIRVDGKFFTFRVLL